MSGQQGWELDTEAVTVQNTANILVVLVPNALAAHIYHHDMPSREGPVPCWTYITDGLATCGQREIVLTIRREPGEFLGRYPREPLQFFVHLHQLALQGAFVDAGECSEFDASGFLGHPLLRAMAYMAPGAIEGVTIPADALTALLLTGEELEVVKTYGLSRLLALYGQATAHYPCPPWSDRNHRSLVNVQAMKGCALDEMARVHAPGMTVYLENNTITLRLRPSARQRVHEAIAELPAEIPLALVTEIDAGANACLVWQPGQAEPGGIAAPGSDATRVAGCFAGFVPQQSRDGGQILEDGLVLMLTDSSWVVVRKALEIGRAAMVTATDGGMDFLLEWPKA